MRTLSSMLTESISSGEFKKYIKILINDINEFRSTAEEVGVDIDGPVGDLLDSIVEQAEALTKNSRAARQLDNDSLDNLVSLNESVIDTLKEFLGGNVNEDTAVADLESLAGCLASLAEGTFNKEDWGWE